MTFWTGMRSMTAYTRHLSHLKVVILAIQLYCTAGLRKRDPIALLSGARERGDNGVTYLFSFTLNTRQFWFGALFSASSELLMPPTISLRDGWAAMLMGASSPLASSSSSSSSSLLSPSTR